MIKLSAWEDLKIKEINHLRSLEKPLILNQAIFSGLQSSTLIIFQMCLSMVTFSLYNLIFTEKLSLS